MQQAFYATIFAIFSDITIGFVGDTEVSFLENAGLVEFTVGVLSETILETTVILNVSTEGENADRMKF